jgi:hypothetical protein
LVFWAGMAFRALQRGDLPLAGVYLAGGVALTVHRLTRISASQRCAYALYISCYVGHDCL